VDELNLITMLPCEWDAHFELGADIDLGSQSNTSFSPIGIQDTPFVGVFDGGGHVISRLSIEGGGYLGLFGRLGRGAEVRNLGIVDVNVIGVDDYVGALAGRSDGNVTACYCTGSVTWYWRFARG
jgi:hypothetical protein